MKRDESVAKLEELEQEYNQLAAEIKAARQELEGLHERKVYDRALIQIKESEEVLGALLGPINKLTTMLNLTESSPRSNIKSSTQLAAIHLLQTRLETYELRLDREQRIYDLKIENYAIKITHFKALKMADREARLLKIAQLKQELMRLEA